MVNTHKHEPRKRPTFDEMLQEAPEKRKVDLLLNEVGFDDFDLPNYGIYKKYMSLNNNT